MTIPVSRPNRPENSAARAPAVVARRHSQQNVTTLIVDHLHFKRPAFEGCTMLLTGRITYTGCTSMEVRVDSYVESLDGTRELVNSAYLVRVALDESGRPTPVPPLIPEGEEEIAEWNAAEERNRLRRMR